MSEQSPADSADTEILRVAFLLFPKNSGQSAFPAVVRIAV